MEAIYKIYEYITGQLLIPTQENELEDHCLAAIYSRRGVSQVLPQMAMVWLRRIEHHVKWVVLLRSGIQNTGT